MTTQDPATKKRRTGSPTARRPAQSIVLYFFAALLAIFSGFPFYWMLVSALRTPETVMRSRSLVPGDVSLGSFRTLFETTSVVTYVVNSVVLSCAVAIVCVVISAAVAYLLTRWDRWIGRALAVGVLFAYMVPEVLLVIPIFVLLGWMQLSDTLLGLGLGLMSVSLPLGIWLMIGFFRSLPFEIEEAALVDGASWWQVFRRVVLPMARPGLLTVGIFTFVLTWTDYVFGVTLVSSNDVKTLPVGLATLFGQFDANWGVIMASAIVMTAPMVLVVALLGKFIVSGMTQGASKG